jgi:mono/diheme cytochrome c family protein
MRKLKRIAIAALALGIVAYVAYHWWRTKNVSAVQRGYRVAESKGCFTCHGPGGLAKRMTPNPGYGLDEVPDWSASLMTMYSQSEEEIREWILDGVSKRVAADPEQMKLREKMIIEMPEWRGLLSEGELNDLVAYIKAVSDFERPQDEKAEAGRQAALSLGCFSCHGPQGRGSMPNVRAFKGYIPSWDGADFPELCRDDQEIREWILDGITQRFKSSRLARFFLERQPIKMPAYRGHVTDEQVDRIIDYIHWLRRRPY